MLRVRWFAVASRAFHRGGRRTAPCRIGVGVVIARGWSHGRRVIVVQPAYRWTCFLARGDTSLLSAGIPSSPLLRWVWVWLRRWPSLWPACRDIDARGAGPLLYPARRRKAKDPPPELQKIVVERAVASDGSSSNKKKTVLGRRPGKSKDFAAAARPLVRGKRIRWVPLQIPPCQEHRLGLKAARSTGSYGALRHGPGHAALATMAVCEAYGLTTTRTACARQRALNFIATAQQRVVGKKPDQAATITSTSWQLSAAQVGQIAGLDVSPPTHSRTPRTILISADRKSSVSGCEQIAKSLSVQARTLRCRQLLGWTSTPILPGVRSAREEQSGQSQATSLFFATLGVSRRRRRQGDQWNNKLQAALVESRMQATGRGTQNS